MKKISIFPCKTVPGVELPCQQELQTGSRGRYTSQKCSPPLAQSVCTETETGRHQPSPELSCGDGCSPSYLRGFGKRVQSDQVDLQRALLLHGKGEGQVAKGIKRHRNFGAHRAHQSGLEEAVEDVYNDGVVSLDVVLPRLLCHHLWRSNPTIKYILNNMVITF